MKKTIREIPIVEVEVFSKDPSERAAEVSRLIQLAENYAKLKYANNNNSTNTATIGFHTDYPDILKVILNN